MNLKEILDLIAIREYTILAINNPLVKKSDVKEMSNLCILLDKKIIDFLTGNEFREYIDFTDAKAAVEEAIRTNNVKSNLK